MPAGRFILFLILVTVLAACDLQAQNTNIPLNGYGDRLLRRYAILDTSLDLHTSMRPYGRKDISSWMQKNYGKPTNTLESYDSRDVFNTFWLRDDASEFLEGFQTGRNKPLLGIFFKESANFFHTEGDHYFVNLNPVIYNSFGGTSDSGKLVFENTRGLEVRAGIDDRVGFYVFATDNQATYPGYVTDAANLNVQKVVPSLGWSKPFKAQGFDFPVSRGHMDVQLFEHLSLQVGQDKMFVGDGVRSLVWSDNAREPFYVRLQTQFWRIRYQANFLSLINMNQPKLPDNRWRKKYASLHQLNVEVLPNLDLGIFETVVFQRNDSLGYPTGFDLNYANPLIFYRSVEWGLGSPDNVLLGLLWKWTFLQQYAFYGQFVLDELRFFDLTKATGWWGNKYALQTGLQYINAFGLDFLDLQYEMNLVRPYMYSYSNDNGSSYTHYAQAIAHPLGANFAEHLFTVNYQPLAQWNLSNVFFTAVSGADSAGMNYGADIFLNNDSHVQDYGNDLLQGFRTTTLYNETTLSWQFWHNTFIDARVVYRSSTGTQPIKDQEWFFSLGVRMNAVIPTFRF
ncbi:MAG: hypothetical protein R2767_09920 [Chitinophagales bacterium]|nr:hypothetical protein [Chitinophagales bacterium]